MSATPVPSGEIHQEFDVSHSPPGSWYAKQWYVLMLLHFVWKMWHLGYAWTARFTFGVLISPTHRAICGSHSPPGFWLGKHWHVLMFLDVGWKILHFGYAWAARSTFGVLSSPPQRALYHQTLCLATSCGLFAMCTVSKVPLPPHSPGAGTVPPMEVSSFSSRRDVFQQNSLVKTPQCVFF